MDEPLKRRLIGASVLASLVVIFVPMMFEESSEPVDEIDPTRIPPMPPRVEQFSSSQVAPLTEGVPAPLPPPTEPPSQPTPISELRTLPAYDRAPASAAVEEPMPFEVVEEESAPLPIVEEAPLSTSAPVSSKLSRAAPAPAETRPAAAPQKASIASPEAVAAAPEAPRPEYGLTSWVVQVGAFSSKETAVGLVDRLKSQRFPAFIEDVLVGERTLYRVRVGPEVDKRNAEKVMAQIDQKLSLKGDVVRYP